MDGFRKRIRLSQVIGPLGDEERYLLMDEVFAERLQQRMILSHPHIVALNDHFYRENELFIVLHFAPGGTLRSFLRKHGSLSEDWARGFFQQIILALGGFFQQIILVFEITLTFGYAHELGIFFREIKLEYMLLEDNRVMLCDLGFSESVWFESASYSLSPNDPHIAPELLPDPNAKNFRNPSVPEHDGKASDLFAAGVCLHAMIFGKYPKCSDSNEHYIYDIRDGSSFNIPSHSEKGPVSEGCRDFVAGLLRPDPKERLTMEGILSHPWFNGVVPKEFSEFNEFRFENKKDVQEGCAARKRDMLSVLRERFEKLKLGIKNLLMRRGS